MDFKKHLCSYWTTNGSPGIRTSSNRKPCPSPATTVARKVTKQTNVEARTSTKRVVDELEVEAEDVLAGDVDVRDAETLRNATSQKSYASNAEIKGITHMSARRRKKMLTRRQKKLKRRLHSPFAKYLVRKKRTSHAKSA